MVVVTLLQARWSAVFLCASCRLRSTLALFTSTSATQRKPGKPTFAGHAHAQLNRSEDISTHQP